MTQLIISEKPDASKKIASALSDNAPIEKKIKGIRYYEIKNKGKDIIVASTVGHLFNLKEKEKKGFSYPIFDLEWVPSYQASKSSAFTKNYLDVLAILSKKADSFVIATDNDSEGALIGWTCIKFICNKNDASRMKFSTLVKEELIESYETASKHLDFPLIEAGETRHYLDHYYGMNSSKALTLSLKNAGMFKLLSSGRVQSPILAILADREKEILNFKSKPYWEIIARLQIDNDELKIFHENGKIFDHEKADSIYKNCLNKKAKVIKVTRKEYLVNPYPAFNITSLQTEAYKNFGYSPKMTLDLAQSLYIKAHISYPRTSSEKLDSRVNYKEIFNSLTKIDNFKILTQKILSKPSLKPIQGNKTDPAHIAIYPTKEIPDFESLSKDGKNIYSLIVKRFLAAFSDPAKRESMDILFDINKEKFKVNGKRTISPGWMSFYEPYIRFEEISLPNLKENQEFSVDELIKHEDKTKPPNRYSQGSIISEMEKKNLGTRATRAQILQILYDRNYIKEKSIEVTDIGRAVAETLEKYSPDLVSEKLTRHFENELEQIIDKKKTKDEILEEAKEILTKILEKIKKNEKEIGKFLLEALKETRSKESLLGTCPECNGDLKILFSRKTKKKFVACSNYPNCKNTYSLPQGAIIPTEKVCQYCKTPIIKVVRKGKRPFEMCLTYNCKSKESWNKKAD